MQRARQLSRIGNLVIVDETKVALHVHALEEGTCRSRKFKVALADALGTQSVLALVDALSDVLSALCNRSRCIVQDQLSEKVGFTVWSVDACPFRKFMNSRSVGAVGVGAAF